MLQQTQVSTVIPYYNRFLERFPDLKSLAGAAEREVLKFWSGLGYYSRARNIHRAARQILDKHKEFPERFEDILALPGIGKYTAGAICSIAFNQARPIVDGNIRRVITRLDAIEENTSEILFWDRMQSWIPKRRPSSFNQAMMELGAMICVPIQPRCRLCPVKGLCEAQRLNIQNRIPAARRRQTVRHIQITVLMLEREGRILLTSLDKLPFIPGKWALPCAEIPCCESPQGAASELSRKVVGSHIPLALCGKINHSISNRRITAYAFSGKLEPVGRHLRATEGFCWTPIAGSTGMITSSLFRKILQNCGKSHANEA